MTFEIEKHLETAVETGLAGVRAVVDVPDLIEKAKSLDIADDTAYGLAGEIVKKIRSATRDADEERKKITGPLNESVRTVNALYKRMIEPLERAEAMLRAGMARYAVVKREREEEERRKAQEIFLKAAEKAEAEEKPDLAAAALDIAVRVEDKATQAVKTGRATTTSRKAYQGFVIEDLSAVPAGYLTVDERKVREAYQNGIRSIPGLKIIEGEIVIVR